MTSVCDDLVIDCAISRMAPCWCVFIKHDMYLTVTVSLNYPIGDVGDWI